MRLTSGMITAEQKKKIHTLISKHKIKDEYYREYLQDRFQVESCVYLDEEQASNLIEHLVEITGDTYDKDHNTEFYQKKQAEKNHEYYSEKKLSLITETIKNFSEGYSNSELVNIFLKHTSLDEKKEILKELIK